MGLSNTELPENIVKPHPDDRNWVNDLERSATFASGSRVRSFCELKTAQPAQFLRGPLVPERVRLGQELRHNPTASGAADYARLHPARLDRGTAIPKPPKKKRKRRSPKPPKVAGTYAYESASVLSRKKKAAKKG
jgi:hypothetical protein